MHNYRAWCKRGVNKSAWQVLQFVCEKKKTETEKESHQRATCKEESTHHIRQGVHRRSEELHARRHFTVVLFLLTACSASVLCSVFSDCPKKKELPLEVVVKAKRKEKGEEERTSPSKKLKKGARHHHHTLKLSFVLSGPR